MRYLWWGRGGTKQGHAVCMKHDRVDTNNTHTIPSNDVVFVFSLVFVTIHVAAAILSLRTQIEFFVLLLRLYEIRGTLS
jgi:hypothetical protein